MAPRPVKPDLPHSIQPTEGRREASLFLCQAADGRQNRAALRIENTECHQLKSEDSAGEMDLDADTAALFQS